MRLSSCMVGYSDQCTVLQCFCAAFSGCHKLHEQGHTLAVPEKRHIV